MKKAIITHANGTQLGITAPDGKDMVFDPALLQHGILSLGEYGGSGIKVAAFKDWQCAVFTQDDGYVIEELNPF